MALRLAVGASFLAGAASENLRGLGCTAIAVDGAASEDGAFAGMNADCSSCDPRLNWVPAGDHAEGARRHIYVFSGEAPRFVGFERGELYQPKKGQNLTKSVGTIPQVKKTYGYWEGVLPLMNEKGLTLGESSCAARLLNYPVGQAPAVDPRTGKAPIEALMDLTNIMQVALERCETARCGVETMGRLSDEYGFFPMVGEWSEGLEKESKIAFDDGGEAVTLADRSGEAWIFHVVGGVPGVAKSVWAAQRVPKGHAAFVANNFVIRELPETPTEDYLFSEKIRAVALAAGIWDGKGPLDFARTFAPDTVTFQSPAGSAPIPLYTSLRQWRLLTLAAPEAYGSMPLPVDPLDLPTSVRVEKALKPEGVWAFLSDLYQGSEFDLRQGILAGPFGNPFRSEGGNATAHVGQIPRGISIPRTSYSVIGQSRPEAEPVMWFAVDTPATSVYVPFYPSVGNHRAEAYTKGTLLDFRRDSAFWAFDFVANWASLQNWNHASEKFIMPLRFRLHTEIQSGMKEAEAKAKKDGPHALAKFQVETQERVVDRWWRLADELIVAYNDGFFNNATSKRLGLSLGYPEWWARDIGLSADVHPIYVKHDPTPELTCRSTPDSCPPDFRSTASPLPAVFNFATSTWTYENATEAMASIMDDTAMETVTSGLLSLASSVALVVAGVVMGRLYERRSAAAKSELSEGPYVRIA